MGRRNDIDWEAIAIDWRTGQWTARQLGLKHGVAHSSIARRAEREGWVQDLSEQVQTLTAARLIDRDPAREPKAPKPQAQPKAQPEARVAAAIDRAASTNVAVILAHRDDVRQAREMTASLMQELRTLSVDDPVLVSLLAKADISVDGKPVDVKARAKLVATLRRAGELGARAAIHKQLTDAMRVQQLLERLAFGIDRLTPLSGLDPDGVDSDFRTRMLNARRRAVQPQQPE